AGFGLRRGRGRLFFFLSFFFFLLLFFFLPFLFFLLFGLVGLLFFFCGRNFGRGDSFRFLFFFAFVDDFAQAFGPVGEGLLQLLVDFSQSFDLFADLRRRTFGTDAVPFVGELFDRFEIRVDLPRGVARKQLGVFAAAGRQAGHGHGAERSAD